MGISHKLKPEISSFILEAKKNKPALGCRSLATLVFDKFQIQISKSRINALIKESGLSMPVGRRSKAEHRGQIKSRQGLTETPIKAVIKTAAKSVLDLSQVPPPPPEEIVAPAIELSAPQEVTPQAILPPAEPPSAAPVVETQPASPPEASKPTEPPAASKETPVTLPEISFPEEMESCGGLILKAIDYLLGGTFYLKEVLQSRIKIPAAELLAKTEGLLYAPFCAAAPGNLAGAQDLLRTFSGKQFSSEELNAYADQLQQADNNLQREISTTLTKVFQEIRGIQCNLSEAEAFYLDGQLHTIWSSSHVPSDFSLSLHQAKKNLTDFLKQGQPLILLTAPGYETPSKELFDFIYSLEHGQNQLNRLTLYNHKLEGIDTLHPTEEKKRRFIFGLWPWQFGRFRKARVSGEFIPWHFSGLKRDLFFTETEFALLQPNTEQSVRLRACALKTNLAEKIKLLIVTNLTPQELPSQELLEAYLGRWPNPQESFEDYSRKIELFTYTADTRQAFSLEGVGLSPAASFEIKGLFSDYLKGLDLYARWRILPSGYENAEFLQVKERFYDLKVRLKEENGALSAVFQPQTGYAYLKELQYICQRLNERAIYFFGKRVWFRI